MCGICGQFNFERREPVLREMIVRMARSIAHRGPDDEGFFIAGPVGLGFRRLSIIDLAAGHQPMSDAEETVWIIFNGELPTSDFSPFTLCDRQPSAWRLKASRSRGETLQSRIERIIIFILTNGQILDPFALSNTFIIGYHRVKEGGPLCISRFSSKLQLLQ
jgi:hypothetical protein